MNLCFNHQLEQFTGAVASRSIQMFLEWFALTQMFEVFMTEELHGVKHGQL